MSQIQQDTQTEAFSQGNFVISIDDHKITKHKESKAYKYYHCIYLNKIESLKYEDSRNETILYFGVILIGLSFFLFSINIFELPIISDIIQGVALGILLLTLGFIMLMIYVFLVKTKLIISASSDHIEVDFNERLLNTLKDKINPPYDKKKEDPYLR